MGVWSWVEWRRAEGRGKEERGETADPHGVVAGPNQQNIYFTYLFYSSHGNKTSSYMLDAKRN